MNNNYFLETEILMYLAFRIFRRYVIYSTLSNKECGIICGSNN